MAGDAAPRTPEGVCGADDDRESSEVLHQRPRLLDRGHRAAPGDRLLDFLHQLREGLAVLARHDRLEAGAEELDVVLLEDASLRELRAEVQPGLPAHPAEDPI